FSSASARAEVRFWSEKQASPHSTTLHRLETYLSNMSTVASDFTQVAPDGSLTNGKFYLQRPGKMRWQYNPPTPILMVSNSSELVYYDYELEQVSHIPLDSTLIGFLAQEKIRFSGKVGIVDFSQSADVIRVTLAQKDKPDDGQLLLEFSDHPLALRNMVITDATQQVTTVSLNNARYGLKLDEELFVFRDPRKPRNQR
ncbi:MAG: outer membrane lipoprotein carrier protein LolA, partial [Rickettsiales bacterium]|nr:outer membrane lipoprotein carrier protein LolA [Rickettsiales bacterium]